MQLPVLETAQIDAAERIFPRLSTMATQSQNTQETPQMCDVTIRSESDYSEESYDISRINPLYVNRDDASTENQAKNSH